MDEFGQGRVSGFIVVESMEAIRDHRPGDAADAMVEFLRRGGSALDPGIAVCVAEGIEDGLYEDVDKGINVDELPSKGRESLSDARFERSGGGWTSRVFGKDVSDIRRFWQSSLTLFEGRQRHEIPTWMNLRLALRTAEPHLFLTRVVVK